MFHNTQYHPPINHIADTELLCAECILETKKVHIFGMLIILLYTMLISLSLSYYSPRKGLLFPFLKETQSQRIFTR